LSARSSVNSAARPVKGQRPRFAKRATHTRRTTAVSASAQSNRRLRPARGSAIMHPAKKAQIIVCNSLIRSNRGIRVCSCCGRVSESLFSFISHQLAIAGERENLFHHLVGEEARGIDLHGVRGWHEGR